MKRLGVLVPLLAHLACTHPLNNSAAKQNLRQIQAFEYESQLTQKSQALKEAPIEPKEDVLKQVNEVFSKAKESSSRDTFQLNLKDVKQFALENNLGLKIDRFGPAISEESRISEAWKFEPTLGATANYTKSRDSNGLITENVIAEPAVTIPNHLGGQLTLSLPYTRSEGTSRSDPFTGSASEAPFKVNSPSLKFTLDQPLLRNAGLSVNYASIKIAGLQARQADARMKLATIRLLASAERAYWSYYTAFENLRIQKKKYELSKEQLRYARRMVEEGVRTNVEVSRASAGVAREFESVIRAETQRRRSERSLKRLINVPKFPVESKTVFEPVTHPRPVGLTFDRQKVLKLALAKRTDMFENEIQLAIDQLSADVNGNAVLPDLRLNVSYTYAGSKSAFSDAVDTLLDRELDSSGGGVSFSIPLALNQAARARWRQSMLLRKRTLARRQELKMAVREDVLNAVDAVEQTWQSVLANRHAVRLSEETYSAEKEQFAVGSVTSTDVLLALTSLASAQQAYVRSRANYHTSLVDLAQSTGTILGESGVAWPKLSEVGEE